MRKILAYSLLFSGFGLSPLWAAIAIIYAGAHSEYVPQEYWATAPWLILPGLAACIPTIGIAVATTVVFETTRGSPSKKSARALLTFVGSTALILLIGFRLAHHKMQGPKPWQSLAEDEKQERKAELAEAFIRNNEALKAMGRINYATKIRSITNEKEGPYELAFEIDGNNQRVIAILGVSVLPDGPKFDVTCAITDAEPSSFYEALHAPERACNP